MSVSEPNVTVVIPVYNSAGTLQRAVRSVQRQSLKDIELILVNDGSHDQSQTVAEGLADADTRIRVIAFPSNNGKSYAMNRAIALASGRWIAVLDADDWYEPDRLDVLVAEGEQSDVPLVADNQYFHDAGANAVVRTAFSDSDSDTPLTRETFIAASDPYADFNYGMLKPIVRLDFIRSSGLAYRENARLSEDFLYLVEFLAANGVGRVLARPLYNWTQSFGSISHEWTTTGAGRWRYDFQGALEANTDLSKVLIESGEHQLADLLAARGKAFRRLHEFSNLTRTCGSGAGIPRLLSAVAMHPSVWPLITRRALNRAGLLKRA